jgi:hypothetical protein
MIKLNVGHGRMLVLLRLDIRNELIDHDRLEVHHSATSQANTVSFRNYSLSI